MRYRINEPIFTTVLKDIDAFVPRPGSFYIAGTSTEDRSRQAALWVGGRNDVTFAHLAGADAATMIFNVGAEVAKVRSRSVSDISAFLFARAQTCIYLDITGLPHHVWAPLLRGIRTRSEPAFCVYVEPTDYRFSSAPTLTSIFDLSESIEGISPLPGFASLTKAVDDDSLFVPILGFEGARFAFILETVQPKSANICPVIGVPGFRPEYAFHSYLGNRAQLTETRAWQNVRFAPANCPFSLYHLLAEIAQPPVRHLKVAPIGTKPHALGALLYSLDYPSTTEILYDYPVPRAQSTVGTSRVCVYDLSLLPPIRPDRGTNP